MIICNNAGLLQSRAVCRSLAAYGYDGVNRLSGLAFDVFGTSADQTLGFAYNPASQIVTRTASNAAYASNTAYNVSRAYAVNGLNQYTTAGPAAFSYDANGNLTSDGSSTMVKMYENRLVSASGATPASLSYEPCAPLFQTSGGAPGTTQFLYDGDELVAEYNASGTMLRRYVHGIGTDDPILWYEGATLTQRRSLQADHQGSIIGVANSSGASIAINAYDAWGIPNSTNQGRFQYTGQIFLPELGMYHYKARLYSPTLGRFLQTDPVGYEDQVNLYAYVGNDPVNMVDPTGMAIRKVTEVVSTIIRRLEPGPNAKEGLPTTNKGNPTIGERRWAQSKYKEHGCHNCGSREGKGFADHIPPKSLAGDSPMKIYPSCANCSAHQGGIVSSILRGSAKILAAIAAVGSEELQAAREDPLKAIVDWSILSDIDEYILSGQPAGQGMDSLMCMQYNTSCPNQ